MPTLRSALVDLRYASGADVESFDYLLPRSEGKVKRFSAKPNPVDDFLDHVIDPAKWSVTGAVTEASYIGIDGLLAAAPSTPGWDQAGAVYKPAILAQVGRMVMARAVAEHPVEFMLGFQEYDFTVDNPALPTTWTLKQTVAPQDLRNSMGLIWRAGSLYFFEGGAAGNEEYLAACPWRGSSAGNLFPLQVAFIFTATGWEIWAHLPGVWDRALKVKEYVRPGSGHNPLGYSFCWNKFTADDSLAFYNMAFEFKSNALLQGARVITANASDYVYPGSLVAADNQGVNAAKPGVLRVRFPTMGTALYTLAQLAQITQHLTGAQLYAVDFELNGDVVLDHPVRITINDATLQAQPVIPA